MSDEVEQVTAETVCRETLETTVCLELARVQRNNGKLVGKTEIGFLDHMLSTLAKFSGLRISVKRFEADTNVDLHHGVEDLGIALGVAFRKLINYNSVARFGHAIVPMDEALTLAAVDLSGRPFLGFEVTFGTPTIGDFPVELLEEFLRAFSNNAQITLHVRSLAGRNSHHVAESAFKAIGVALASAIRESDTPMSTKGAVTV